LLLIFWAPVLLHRRRSKRRKIWRWQGLATWQMLRLVFRSKRRRRRRRRGEGEIKTFDKKGLHAGKFSVKYKGDINWWMKVYRVKQYAKSERW